MSDIEIKPVFVSPLLVSPELPKITMWHRAKSWIWNFCRRPLVRIRQRELQQIAAEMKYDLNRDLLPRLYKHRSECRECVDAYLALQSEVFVSSISLILRKMQCTDHFIYFNAFLNSHQKKFERNEEVSRWINGL